MIWFDNSVEWQFWTGVFVIELTFLLLKPTSTPAKPVRFVNLSKEDSIQVTRYSKKKQALLTNEIYYGVQLQIESEWTWLFVFGQS